MLRFQNFLWFFVIAVVITIPGQLLSQSKDSFTVYAFLLDECRICQEIAPELNKIYQLAEKEGIGFMGYLPNYSSTEAGIKKFKKKYKISFPTLTDYDKNNAKRFAATILPEIIVYNETSKDIIYRGALNNLFYAPGKRRHQITEHYVKDAIFAVLEGKKPAILSTEPIGCFINYSENPF